MFDSLDAPSRPREEPAWIPLRARGLTPAELESTPPGPGLARVLAEMDPVNMAGYDLVSFLGASERQASWTASRQLAAVAELAHRRPTTKVEVCAPDQRRDQGRVSRFAAQQVLGGFKESLARAVLRVDPDAARKRHERSVADRKVELVPLADGMAGIWALLRADRAVAVFEGITAMAEKAKASDDPRTLDQRRADVLADIGTALLDRPDLPRRHGRRPHLQVTVGATTLLGLDDHPGELAGYGPINADLAREIAGDATWTRILTDPVSGTLVDYGTTVYRPPQSLADRLVAKHRRCRGPGCRMPASRCHLDHTIAFPDGPTGESNLGPLCELDHIGKHEAGWTCRQTSDGAYVWTSPTRHVYVDPLEPVLESPDRPPPDRPPPGRPPPDRPPPGRPPDQQPPDQQPPDQQPDDQTGAPVDDDPPF